MHNNPAIYPKFLIVSFLIAFWASASQAVAQGVEAPGVVRIGLLRYAPRRLLPLTRLNILPDDIGVAGGRLAIEDNNTTGQFTGQKFELKDVMVPRDGDPKKAFDNLIKQGISFVIIMAPAKTVLALADAVRDQDVLIFNARATDDYLRGKACRDNVMHIAPSRAMLADGLAQYLVWKKWRRWFLIHGSHDADKAFASAVRRAAKRFGAKIVEEREFKDTGGTRRTDTGQAQVKRQIISFTQGAAKHDVIVTADESEVFGEYLPYRVWEARPVVGTQGLYPTSWHAGHEQWGATQIQNRFMRSQKRLMRSLDLHVWIALRIIGDTAARTGSTEFAKMQAYIKSPKLGIAAFKGQKLSFRDWNWQLRQPILLATAKMTVSVAPQKGFLHPVSRLDTLGYDRPETDCKLKQGERKK